METKECPEDLIGRAQDRIALMIEHLNFEYRDRLEQMGDFDRSVFTGKLWALDETYNDLKKAARQIEESKKLKAA